MIVLILISGIYRLHPQEDLATSSEKLASSLKIQPCPMTSTESIATTLRSTRRPLNRVPKFVSSPNKLEISTRNNKVTKRRTLHSTTNKINKAHKIRACDICKKEFVGPKYFQHMKEHFHGPKYHCDTCESNCAMLPTVIKIYCLHSLYQMH